MLWVGKQAAEEGSICHLSTKGTTIKVLGKNMEQGLGSASTLKVVIEYNH